MIENFWQLYTNWLHEKLPNYFEALHEGASIESIEKIEKELEIKFPEELKTLYRLNDGDQSIDLGLVQGVFLGFRFLSLTELKRHWEEWEEFYGYGNFTSKYDGSSFPEKAIRVKYADANWIPVFTDGGANFIGIDLNPDKNGARGQIINFGRDEDDKIVIAPNLTAFLELIAKEIESGNCTELQ